MSAPNSSFKIIATTRNQGTQYLVDFQGEREDNEQTKQRFDAALELAAQDEFQASLSRHS